MIIILVLSSCEKYQLSHDLVGNWRILGIFFQVSITPNFTHLKLNKNNTYEILKNDTILEQGVLRISKGTLESYNEEYWELHLEERYRSDTNPNIGGHYAFEFISGDTLSLGTPWFTDGCGLGFVRDD